MTWAEFLDAFQPIRPRNDHLLLTASLGLIVIGYIMVTSASLHLGEKVSGDVLHYPLRQMIHIGIGLVCAALLMTVKMEFWEQIGPWLFIFGLLLLVIVLIPGLGVEVNGATRWLQLPGIRIQVSEIVKLISIIFMAGYVSRHIEAVRVSAYGLFKPLMLFALACVLLLKEPDFGSAVVIVTIAMGVMFLGGARIGQFIGLVVFLAVLGAGLIYMEPYRMVRVTSFLDPWADPLDTGFQLTNALIAFGRGEWFGVGLGGSIQKLSYLPEAHTDFLFSVLAEELGLFGVCFVIVQYSILVWRAFVIGAKAERTGLIFSAYIAYGLAILFGFQAFINMGVNMGILPTKGLTLPLMSYGGGSMIVMLCGLALLFRVHSETEAVTDNLIRGNPVWRHV